MRHPWSAAAAWQFVTEVLASPGLTVLTLTAPDADVG